MAEVSPMFTVSAVAEAVAAAIPDLSLIHI